MKSLKLLFLIIFPVSLFSQVQGDWHAILEIGATQIPLTIHIDEGKNSILLDSPDQSVMGKETDTVILEQDRVYFEVKEWGVIYNGKYQAAEGKIIGDFEQGGFKTEMKFQREKMEKKVIKRPQTPPESVSYEKVEVEFKNKKAKITLNGTLTIPEGDGPFPTVVLASGTGQQYRNEELVKHKPFEVLAHHLSSNGVMVLRFDDRYFGESSIKFYESSMEDFGSDVSAAIDFVYKNKKADRSKIGVVGHSEGSIHAPIAATMNSKIKFIVSLAGVGEQGINLLVKQRRELLILEGIAMESTLEKDSVMLFNLFNEIDSEEGLTKEKINTIVDDFFEGLTDEETKQFGESIPMVKKSLADFFTLHAIQSFLKYNPKEYWTQIDLPLLALNASKDIQVDAGRNIEGFKKLNQNSKSEYYVFEGMNHLFQKCESCRMEEYGMIETTIEPEVMEKVTAWIKGL